MRSVPEGSREAGEEEGREGGKEMGGNKDNISGRNQGKAPSRAEFDVGRKGMRGAPAPVNTRNTPAWVKQTERVSGTTSRDLISVNTEELFGINPAQMMAIFGQYAEELKGAKDVNAKRALMFNLYAKVFNSNATGNGGF